MGAEFSDKRFQCKREDLNKLFNEYVTQLVYEYGHSGYSGTLKECDGLEITDEVFNDEDKGYEWLEYNTNKWEAAKVVRIKNDGEDYWLVGGICSS